MDQKLERDVDGEQPRPPRKDGLADERDDPQTQPYVVRKEQHENADSSLDQPSEDVG
jgi:hypothetical protein